MTLEQQQTFSHCTKVSATPLYMRASWMLVSIALSRGQSDTKAQWTGLHRFENFERDRQEQT